MSFLNSSDSKSDSSQKTSTSNSNENNNVSNTNGGVNISKLGGGSTVINTDAGAIKGITQTAGDSIALAGQVSSDSQALLKSLANSVLDFSRSTGTMVADTTLTSQKQAFQFGENAFSVVEQTTNDAQNFEKSALNTVADSQAGAFRDALDFVGKVVGNAQESLGSTVAAINEIGKQQNTSADQRVQDTATTAIKYVAIGLGVIGVAAAVAFSSRH